MPRDPLHPCFPLTLLTFAACLQFLCYFSNLDSLVPKGHAMTCARHGSVNFATITIVARTPRHQGSWCVLLIFWAWLKAGGWVVPKTGGRRFCDLGASSAFYNSWNWTLQKSWNITNKMCMPKGIANETPTIYLFSLLVSKKLTYM